MPKTEKTRLIRSFADKPFCLPILQKCVISYVNIVIFPFVC